MYCVILGTIIGLILILYTPLCSFLKLAPLSLSQFILAAGISVASVMWYELVKIIKYIRKKQIEK
ncbi:cation transporting ATPase C-terminal domain-containing protein [Clostridium chromiireducens]|uniref:cation transporting ATPase C-terminal domain-containing protein n=1 Tax=Clostridium chromiireducens TaxID=225345 RepID=UPI00311A978A